MLWGSGLADGAVGCGFMRGATRRQSRRQTTSLFTRLARLVLPIPVTSWFSPDAWPSVEIRSTESVRTECEGCTVFGNEGLCRLVQSGLGLRVCGAVEGDGLS